MLQINKTWRRPFYWGIAAWFIFTIPNGIFILGAPQIILTWLTASFLFFIAAFAFGYFRPKPSSFEKQFVTAGPVMLFFGNLFAWLLMFS